MLEDVTKSGKQMLSNMFKIGGLLAVIIYVISPIDLLPGNPIDDILLVMAYLSYVGIDIFNLNKK